MLSQLPRPDIESLVASRDLGAGALLNYPELSGPVLGPRRRRPADPVPC
jgi:hypothetical protein